jgi:hypothetical protein
MRAYESLNISSDFQQVLEQSRLANELGAAVHLAPNSNGLLRRIGLYAEDYGANPMQRVS